MFNAQIKSPNSIYFFTGEVIQILPESEKILFNASYSGCVQYLNKRIKNYYFTDYGRTKEKNPDFRCRHAKNGCKAKVTLFQSCTKKREFSIIGPKRHTTGKCTIV